MEIVIGVVAVLVAGFVVYNFLTKKKDTGLQPGDNVENGGPGEASQDKK